MAVFECKMSSCDIMSNETMSDDEVVASYVPPRYLFLVFVCLAFVLFSVYPDDEKLVFNSSTSF